MEETGNYTNYTEFQLQGLTYRVLQQVAKNMGLPSNVKKMYLVQLIYAKTHKTPEEVEEIVQQVRYERQMLSQSNVSKRRRKQKMRLQAMEVSSSNTCDSPPIDMTPKRSYSPDMPNLRAVIKYFPQTTLSPKNTSDRVLRSYNVKSYKRPNYSLINNSVVELVKASERASRPKEKETQISIISHEGRMPRLNVTARCVLRKYLPRSYLRGENQITSASVTTQTSKSSALLPAKRYRTISGITTRPSAEGPLKTNYEYVKSIGFRRTDGRISKINAVVQTPAPITYNIPPITYNIPPITYDKSTITYNKLAPIIYKSAPITYNNTPTTYNNALRTYKNAPTTYKNAPITYEDRPITYKDAPSTYMNAPITYKNAPTTYKNAPSTYENAPTTYKNAPSTYENAPITYKNAPSTYENAPITYKNAPSTCENAPITYKNAPSTYEHALITYKNAPSTYENAPITYKNAPSTCENVPSTCENAPSTCENAPSTCENAPSTCENAPSTCENAPITYKNAPSTYENALITYKNAPSIYMNAPVTYKTAPICNIDFDEPSTIYKKVEVTIQDINSNVDTQTFTNPSVSEYMLTGSNMAGDCLPLSDVVPNQVIQSSNEVTSFSIYYHKKIRAEQVRSKKSVSPLPATVAPSVSSSPPPTIPSLLSPPPTSVSTPYTGDQRLPNIRDVFSKFNVAGDNNYPTIHIPADQPDPAQNTPQVRNDSMLETLYNLKNKSPSLLLMQIATAANTKSVYATATVSTPVPQVPVTPADTLDAFMYEPDSQFTTYWGTSDEVSRICDLTTFAEQDMTLRRYHEVLSTSSLEALESQDAAISIPEMVEDALELISQDGDYMERIGMDVRMQCVLCSWAGSRIILEDHIRKEHLNQITHQELNEWIVTYKLGSLVNQELWLSHVCERDGMLYILSVKYEDPDCFMASLSTLTVTESEVEPKMGTITVYNKVTGEPHTWHGPIPPLHSNMPYENDRNCLRIELSKLELLPNSANLKLLNRSLVLNSPSKVVVGQPELNDIHIIVFVCIQDN